MSESNSLVCICIPTYNAENTISETLVSIINQSYTNLIIKIVDNASTDNTIKIVESFCDSRIVVYRNANNIGGEANFTRCIQLAVGKYAAIFQSDDLYEPEMVSNQILLLERMPQIGAVFVNASLIDKMGNKLGNYGIPNNSISKNYQYDFLTIFCLLLKYSNFLICPSAMVRTDIYRNEIKFWRGDLFKTSSDLDVWLRILQKHSVAIIPKNMINYRISSYQESTHLRERVDKSDLFLVIDYYLTQEYVQNLLTKVDLINYKRLERTDRIVRAVNLYLTDRQAASLDLSKDIISLDAIQAAIFSKRGAITFIAGFLLRFFIFMRLSRIGKLFFINIKKITHK